jgi:DNA-binding GntR family transcriptional regulator
MLLEGECARRAARRGMDLTELWEAQKQMEAAAGKFPAEDFRKYNQTLHACIWQAADNEKIAAVATSLWNGSSFGKTVTESAHCANRSKNTGGYSSASKITTGRARATR